MDEPEIEEDSFVNRDHVMRMPPLAFSDEEMDTLSALASVLPPPARSATGRPQAHCPSSKVTRSRPRAPARDGGATQLLERRRRCRRELRSAVMTQTLGEEIIGWIETLRVPEGALVGQAGAHGVAETRDLAHL